MTILRYLIISSIVFLISCGQKQEQEYAEEAAEEEYYEEAVEEEYYEEAGPELNYELQDLNCKSFNENEGGANFKLGNFYQLSEYDVYQIRNEEKPKNNNILYYRYELGKRFKKCANLDADDWYAAQDFLMVRFNSEGLKAKRKDLMPELEEEFLNINPEIIRFFAAHMIPHPNSMNVNGLTFQEIYDYHFKEEARKLYTANYFLNNRTPLEDQIRMYVDRARTRFFDETVGEMQTRNNYNLGEDLYNYYMMRIGSYDDDYQLENAENMHLYFGFWLRRYLDASAIELNKLLSNVIEQYDPLWYAFMKNHDREKRVKLTQLPDSTLLNYEKGRNDKYRAEMIRNIDSTNAKVIKEGGKITLQLENGKTKVFENIESTEDMPTYYYFDAYFPHPRWVLMRVEEGDWTSSFIVHLYDGRLIEFDHYLSDMHLGPSSRFLICNYYDYETSGMRIYEIIDAKRAESVFGSSLIRIEDSEWTNDGVLIKTPNSYLQANIKWNE